jgi:hypothetical protein
MTGRTGRRTLFAALVIRLIKGSAALGRESSEAGLIFFCLGKQPGDNGITPWFGDRF